MPKPSPPSEAKCPNCHSPFSGDVIDDYRFNVEWDRHFLPCSNVVRCSHCNLMYAWPMPDVSRLDEYYTRFYRAPGRPHHLSGEPLVLGRHLAYLSYITSYVPLSQMRRVYEIGAGFGEMGHLLRTIDPSIELFTHEPDLHVRGHLQNAGYTIMAPESSISGPIDLVISLHSMEHFTNLTQYFQLGSTLRAGGYFFVEVPNCSVVDGWMNRPYDSPHLLFFDLETLTSVFEDRQFTTIAVSKAGVPLSEDFKMSATSKEQFGQWQPCDGKRDAIGFSSPKHLARRLVPNQAKLRVRRLLQSRSTNQLPPGTLDFNNSATQGRLLRGIFQKT